jgi:hypothetical protein
LSLFPGIGTSASWEKLSNNWYGRALENAERVTIGEFEIRLVTALYFAATKLEAFHGCGKGDFRVSHDLEDIVTVVDGRSRAGRRSTSFAEGPATVLEHRIPNAIIEPRLY